MYAAIIKFPLKGIMVGIVAGDERLSAIDLIEGRRRERPARRGTCAWRAVEQLQAYFADPSQPFDVPLAPGGTAFQKKVWRALSTIAPGKTLTYGALAARLGSGPRAIGQACRRNPVPVIVPCHRVVGVRGQGGYCGMTNAAGADIKNWLLEHERNG